MEVMHAAGQASELGEDDHENADKENVVHQQESPQKRLSLTKRFVKKIGKAFHHGHSQVHPAEDVKASVSNVEVDVPILHEATVLKEDEKHEEPITSSIEEEASADETMNAEEQHHNNVPASQPATSNQPLYPSLSALTSLSQPSATNAFTPVKDPYWEKKMRELVGPETVDNAEEVPLERLASRFKSIGISYEPTKVLADAYTPTTKEETLQESATPATEVPSSQNVDERNMSTRSISPIEQLQQANQKLLARMDAADQSKANVAPSSVLGSPVALDELASELDNIFSSLDQIPSPPVVRTTSAMGSQASAPLMNSQRSSIAQDMNESMDYPDDDDVSFTIEEALALDAAMASQPTQMQPASASFQRVPTHPTNFTIRMRCCLDGTEQDLPPEQWSKLALHCGRIWVVEGTRWTRLLLNEREMRVDIGQDPEDAKLELVGIDDETRDRWMLGASDNFICRGCARENNRRVGAKLNGTDVSAAPTPRKTVLSQSSAMRGRSPSVHSQQRGRSPSVASLQRGRTSRPVSASPARSVSKGPRPSTSFVKPKPVPSKTNVGGTRLPMYSMSQPSSSGSGNLPRSNIAKRSSLPRPSFSSSSAKPLLKKPITAHISRNMSISSATSSAYSAYNTSFASTTDTNMLDDISQEQVFTSSRKLNRTPPRSQS
jgi:hypothetical protein